jgi:hypothetical protein
MRERERENSFHLMTILYTHGESYIRFHHGMEAIKRKQEEEKNE